MSGKSLHTYTAYYLSRAGDKSSDQLREICDVRAVVVENDDTTKIQRSQRLDDRDVNDAPDRPLKKHS